MTLSPSSLRLTHWCGADTKPKACREGQGGSRAGAASGEQHKKLRAVATCYTRQRTRRALRPCTPAFVRRPSAPALPLHAAQGAKELPLLLTLSRCIMARSNTFMNLYLRNSAAMNAKQGSRTDK